MRSPGKVPIIALILLLPAPSLFWLPSGSVLAHGQVYPWPDAAGLYALSKGYLFAWMESSGFGGPNTEPAGFLFYLYAAMLSWATGDTHIAQSIFLYSGYSGCLAGVYFLGRTLGLGQMASLAAACFYMLNPIVFSGMPAEALNLRLLPYHAGTPILLALSIKIIDGERLRRHMALFAVATLFLGSAGYSSLQYFVLMLLYISVYSAYRLLRGAGHERAGITLRSALVFLVFFIMNIYWLGIFLYDLGEAYAARQEPGFEDAELLRGFGLDLIQGFMMLPVKDLADPFPWVSEYYKSLTLLATFIFISLAGYAFASKATRERALFPGILLTLSLFLAKGTKNPFDSLGEVVFMSHPYMTRLFRNPSYFELMVVLALALLIGTGAGELIKKIRSVSFRTAAFTAVVLVAAGLAYGKVFILGTAVRGGENALSSQYNFVPDYYWDLGEFFRADNDTTRIASVPAFTRQDWFVAYGWDKKFFGGQFLNIWSGRPLIRPIYPSSSGVNPLFDAAMHPELDSLSPESWLWLIRAAGVEYVTLHNDVDRDLLSRMDDRLGNIDSVYDFIRNSPYLDKDRAFGPVDLYRIKKGLELPRIYAAPGLDLIKNTRFEESIPLLSFLNSEPRPALAFSGQQPEGALEELEASGIAKRVFSPDSGFEASKSFGALMPEDGHPAAHSYTAIDRDGTWAGRFIYDQEPGVYKRLVFHDDGSAESIFANISPKMRKFAFREDYAASLSWHAVDSFKSPGRLISLYGAEQDRGAIGFTDIRYRLVESGQRLSVMNHSPVAVIADIGLTIMPLVEAVEARLFINGREIQVPAEKGRQLQAGVPFAATIKGVPLLSGDNELKIFIRTAKLEKDGRARPLFGLSRRLRADVHEREPGLSSVDRAEGIFISPDGLELTSGSPCGSEYAVGFARDLDWINIESFPMFLMDYSWKAAAGKGAEVSFMIDTDLDHKADLSISRPLREPAKGTERFKTDIRRLLDAHLPGQRDARLAGIGFVAYCDYDAYSGPDDAEPGLQIRSMALSSPGWENQKGGLPVIRVDGMELLLETNASGLLAEAAIPAKEGARSIEVMEDGGMGVYSLFIGNNKLARNPEAHESVGSLPRLSFRRINPTRYVVHVSGAKKGFVLAFLEAYHPGWRAYARPAGRPVSGSMLLDHARSSVEQELGTHFIVNGYANGWLVPDEVARFENGGFDIILEYRPQAAMEAGIFASGAGLVIVLGLAIIRRRKP